MALTLQIQIRFLKWNVNGSGVIHITIALSMVYVVLLYEFTFLYRFVLGHLYYLSKVSTSENGSPVIPMENGGSNEQNSASHSTTTRRLYQHPLQTAPSSSNQFGPNYVQEYSHYQHTSYHGYYGTVNTNMDGSHRSFKRKYTDVSLNYGVENTNMCYIEQSTGYQSSSSHLISYKPVLYSQNWPPHPYYMVPRYMDSRSCIPEDGSQRNVRSQHDNIPIFERRQNEGHMSYNLPGPSGHFNLPGNSPVPSMIGKQNQNFHGGLLSSASRGYNLGINQCFTFPNFVPARNDSIPLPVCGSSTHGIGRISDSYIQRSLPTESPVQSYSSLGIVAISDREEWLGSDVYHRYSRPLSIGGSRDSDRNRWAESCNRVRSFAGAGNTPARWMHEGFSLVEQSSMFDSSNLLDQHQDMRLDIDNMSYEELLALEERIGNVNTGLSDEMLSRCLSETAYRAGDGMEKEAGNCVICLESYRDREQVGVLKCGHDYHICCIKEWLRVKNACPVCKAPALHK